MVKGGAEARVLAIAAPGLQTSVVYGVGSTIRLYVFTMCCHQYNALAAQEDDVLLEIDGVEISQVTGTPAREALICLI